MTALATLAAFVRRDWSIALSYRLAYALELVSILFTLALFYYLSGLIDEEKLDSATGMDQGYFAYVVVGLALIRMLQSGLTSFGSRLNEEQMTGTFETLMATPTRTSLLILGAGAYDLLRATVSGIALIVAAAILFDFKVDTDAAALFTAAVALPAALALFAALGVAVAAFTVVFKQTTALLGLLAAAIGLMAGAYFPISELPGPLHALADVFPFTWAVDVLRGALLEGDAELSRLAYLVAFDAVAIPCALLLFKAGLRRSRQMGTLAHY